MPSTRELKQCDPVKGIAPDQDLCIDARQLPGGDAASRDELVRRVRKACLETGFFYLDNAFDGSAVLQNALAQMQRFFSLHDEDPRKTAVDNRGKQGTYGWMPLFGEPAYQPGTVAHVESFDCGAENDAAPAKVLEGRNAWPDLPGFRQDVCALQDGLSRIAANVLDLVGDAVGLPRAFLSSRCSSGEFNTLRLLHYPGGQAEDVLRDVGIAAHTDFECISLILQTSAGLELTGANGCWYEAPTHPERIVVLQDDMLERWTNGLLKATGHRVRRTLAPRYSIVLFVAVNADQVIRPLEQFLSDSNPARFGATTQRQHIDEELRRSEAYRTESIVQAR